MKYRHISRIIMNISFHFYTKKIPNVGDEMVQQGKIQWALNPRTYMGVDN